MTNTLDFTPNSKDTKTTSHAQAAVWAALLSIRWSPHYHSAWLCATHDYCSIWLYCTSPRYRKHFRFPTALSPVTSWTQYSRRVLRRLHLHTPLDYRVQHHLTMRISFNYYELWINPSFSNPLSITSHLSVLLLHVFHFKPTMLQSLLRWFTHFIIVELPIMLNVHSLQRHN